MIDKIVVKIIEILDAYENLTKIKKEQISYSLTAIISDLSKIIMLYVIFFLIDYPLQFLVISIYTILLRIVIGGYHFKSYWRCLLFTFGYYSLILISNSLSTNNTIITIVFIIFAVILVCLTPSVTKERASIRRYSIIWYKVSASILLVIYYTVYLLFKDSITHLGLMTVIFQSIQLLIMKGVKIYENQNNESIHT